MAIHSEYFVILILVLWTNGAYSEIVTEPAVELRWDFTTCGTSGRFGPSQNDCDETYRGTNLDGEVLVESGIQKWEVPTSGLYLITAWSPSGSVDVARKSGRGVALTGEFRLTKGDTLQILVGQHGSTQDEDLENKAIGGSGGTFVIAKHTNNNEDSILLISGGASCGSGENWNIHNPVSDASLFPLGKNASVVREDNGVRGEKGNGGNAGDLVLRADSSAGGGAGYIGDGETASVKRSSFTEVRNPRPAKSFLSSGFLDKGPGVGGYFMYVDGQRIIESNGGFGGGGSGSRNGGCGAGGGFSGGGGGSMNGWGGGAGSINNGRKQRNDYSSIDVGAVAISFIGHQCCGPVAVYIAITFLAGVLVTLLIGYSIKRIVNSINTEQNTCGRCWKKLRQMKSNETATPKRKT